MFHSIKESISKYFEKEQINKQYQAGNIINIWEKEMGKTIKQNTEIIKLQKQILTIKTSTPTWKTELLFQKEKIIKKINKYSKQIKIKDIRFI